MTVKSSGSAAIERELHVEVEFELPTTAVRATVPAGALLTEAAEAAGVFLDVACGGKGSCGGCAVDLIAGAFAAADGTPIALGGQPRRVLACRTRVGAGEQALRVRVPRHSLVTAGEKVVVDFEHLRSWQCAPTVEKRHLQLEPPSLHHAAGDIERIAAGLEAAGFEATVEASLEALRTAPAACEAGKYDVTVTLVKIRPGHWQIVRVEPGDTTGRVYALAIDVGTTTVVCALVDLADGRILDAASSYNQQIRRADDVASRIAYANTPKTLREMERLIVEQTINRQLRLLLTRHELTPADIARVAVGGNTVMAHLLLGVDPQHLGGVPFQPASNLPPSVPASRLGLHVHPDAPVDLIPSAAAYIGGDITADMDLCGLHETDALTLMVDIGTNAEIAVGDRHRVVACAAPAGPAFEGHGLACGMRASDGAIDRITIEPGSLAVEYTVLGGVRPSGICGSGLIDFLGQAFRAGLLTAAGRFDREAAGACDRLQSVTTADGRELTAFIVAPAEDTDDRVAPVMVTEADIATLLQAKAVIFAGIQIAMKQLGRGFDEIERVYLAGGFARYLDLPNAIALGMLPDIAPQRYTFIGNGSLAGAFLHLVDRQTGPRMRQAALRPEVIELNLDPDFMDAYTMAMFLPHVDRDLFPSVG